MIRDYFKSKYKIILAFASIILVFLFLAFLYDMPIGAYIYAIALCSFFGIIFFSWGCYRYIQKLQSLASLRRSIEYEIDNLPAIESGIEAQYQALIKTLYDKRADAISRYDGDISDMIDYYTIWVHQIKNPIFALRLIMESGELDNFEGKDEMQMELFKIEQYVEMVLQYLRLGSDYTDFVFKEQNLDHIIKQSIKKYSRMFIKKKISLEYEPTGITVYSDEKWLAFVIEQLLSNALKYTLQGKISVYAENAAKTAAVGFSAEAGGMHENDGSAKANGMPDTLVIEDTGIGIQAEDLPRVCDKGYTGYNGRNDKKSTGIGLYLCKEILDKLGHAIDIESKPGVGTKVKITLPQKETWFE